MIKKVRLASVATINEIKTLFEFKEQIEIAPMNLL